MPSFDAFPQGFEEDDHLRSDFVRILTVQQMARSPSSSVRAFNQIDIPRTLVRYWHDPRDLPEDVRACLASWERLQDDGFQLRMFDDASAAAFISERFGERERGAFARCRHPAMRSDYLRMCFILAEGGFYVDADDVLLGDGWKSIFSNGGLKLQPLCYDIPSAGMVRAAEIWRADLPTVGRIFYVNNNPIAAPADHPVLRRALRRSTEKLLGSDLRPEIQSTTGPGNLTAALCAHARELGLTGVAFDFELLHNWDVIAETRWELSYRADKRNWRKMDD